MQNKLSFLAVRNNLFLAAAYLLIIPILRGIANLDMVRSAECLEEAVILTGIFLIVPLSAPEQSNAIQEVVCTKKVSYWKILLLRFIMSMLLLIMIICLFSGIMVWKNCIYFLFCSLCGRNSYKCNGIREPWFYSSHIQQLCCCRLLGVSRILSFKFFGKYIG